MALQDVEITRILMKCVNFAAIKHKEQRRKDAAKTPYVNHPIGVAYILTEEANVTDVSVIQAALLHDTVEDTKTTFDEIEEQFGAEVAHLVREVTDDKALEPAERKQLQIDNAPKHSHKAKLVHLADKLYNLRDLLTNPPEVWTSERIENYFSWSLKVVDGLRGTNKAMENALDQIFVSKQLIASENSKSGITECNEI